MTQEILSNKLKELGVQSENFYTKKSFLIDGIPYIGCYERELKEDFYFYNNFDNNIYKIVFNNNYSFEQNKVTNRFLVPLALCIPILNDEYVEKEDVPYKDMTLRDYVAIQLSIPVSNKEWLNTIINDKGRMGRD